jgi:hypothetical protein
MPCVIKTHIALVGIETGILGPRAAASQSTKSAILAVIYASLISTLYLQLLKKKEWVRIVLVVLTLPIGKILLWGEPL